MNQLSRKMTEFTANGGKMVTIDPRFSVAASKSAEWVPVIPGTDAALIMGMIQWILENKRFEKNFLEAPNQQAAAKRGESSWSDAGYLVRLDTKKYLRADEAGLQGTAEDYVVLSLGQPGLAKEVDAADLLGEVVSVNGIECKTALQLLYERSKEKTLDEYAKLCDIPQETIVRLADEFTSYGKLAVADFYRSLAQHTNGFQTGRAMCILNLLVGNIDHRGGYIAGGSALSAMGDKNGRYQVAKLHPGAVKPAGVKISREGFAYEKTTEFKKKGYPAQRPWFPLTSNVYQEVVAGAMDAYPYPIKILWLHMGTPAWAIPGMKDKIIAGLKDTKKIPLFISTDIVIGDTTMYADYVLPDVTYLEQWGAMGAPPTVVGDVSSVRQPITKAFPQAKSLENIMIDMAKKMDLPGFGDNGFGAGIPLNKEDDWFLKLVANFASQNGKIPGSTEEEQVRYILERGGVFADDSKGYDRLMMKKKVAKLCTIYGERVATTKDSMTGKAFDGLPAYIPVLDSKDNPILDKEYPFITNTYKVSFQTHSRTISAPWLTEILPENFFELNDEDGSKLGLKDGDLIKVSSATNKEGITGKVKLRPGIRPGVISACVGFGHWHYGAADTIIDGKTILGDKKRGLGVNINYVMRVDESVGNTCLQDKIGGSCSFYDSRVKVEKA